jgi:hypothetical protein
MRQVLLCAVALASFATLPACTGYLSSGDSDDGPGDDRGDDDGQCPGGPDCDPAFECKVGEPGPRLTRRLTRVEYDNTVRAVLGVESRFGAAMSADVVVDGYDNNAQALSVSPLLADQLRSAADTIATTAITRQEIVSCGGTGADCARTFLEQKGARLLRRPMAADEMRRWLDVYDVGVETAGSAAAHASGMELMISALLQSPSFLYRTELGEQQGERYALSSYEVASELSYLFWAEPPDDALWSAAQRNELVEADAIESHARRLLTSPKARAAIDRFSSQWLDLDQLAIVAKDPATYPQLTESLRASMAEETKRVIADAIQNGGTFTELLTSTSTFANAELAQFYGVQGPSSPDASGFGPVSLAGSNRFGLLGLGAMLTAHALPNGSSPIHRGKVIRERLLCTELAPPPPGLNAEPPPIYPNATTRERYAQHRSDPACAGCHDLMDPIGYAFEHFDGSGRYRADEGGLAIDDSGNILATAETDGDFDGLAGLASKLAESSEVHACFAQEWLRWSYGLDSGAVDCLADEVAAKFAAGGLKISHLLVALTQTEHFRFRRGV